MKNWQEYENEIMEIGVETVAVDKSTQKPEMCGRNGCDNCLFDEACKTDDFMARTEWLYSEYRKPVVLTDDERKLCELLGEGWIARDSEESLYYFHSKPRKGECVWSGYCVMNILDVFPQCKFEFIKWEDEEPWEVRV